MLHAKRSIKHHVNPFALILPTQIASLGANGIVAIGRDNQNVSVAHRALHNNFDTLAPCVTGTVDHPSASAGRFAVQLFPFVVCTLDQAHKLAAASTAPAVLNVLGLVMMMSTGYFHSMNFAQPGKQMTLAGVLDRILKFVPLNALPGNACIGIVKSFWGGI